MRQLLSWINALGITESGSQKSMEGRQDSDHRKLLALLAMGHTPNFQHTIVIRIRLIQNVHRDNDTFYQIHELVIKLERKRESNLQD